VPVGGKLNVDQPLQRIHPAASRVRKLSAEWPAVFIVFDLLADSQRESVMSLPLSERRALPEEFALRYFPRLGMFRLSPATTRLADAKNWFRKVGGNLDGIIDKLRDEPYRPGERGAMRKIKRVRTADCVVGGFRYGSGRRLVGSLSLGLYDEDGLLDHGCFTSTINKTEQRDLTRQLEGLRKPPGFMGNKPGSPSRWSTERSAVWEPLEPKLVAVVTYDHVSGGRFRHGTHSLRWRPEKSPRQCTFEPVARHGGTDLCLLG
jgi:ATP-dependent DNA ligase